MSKKGGNIQRKRGLDQLMYEIEGIFLQDPHFHGRMYLVWLGMKESDKEHIRKAVKTAVQDYIFTDEYWYAIASDVVKEGSINIQSKVYNYLRKKLFQYNHRATIIKLYDVLQKEKV